MKPARPPRRRGRPPRAVAPEPRRPRTPQAAVTFDAMVTAAERVLDRHGLDGLTTNRVAEVAGVSIGSLYQYFPNKAAIISALFDRYLAQYAAAVTRAIASHGGEPLPALLVRVADAVVDLFEAQPRIHRWLWEMRSAAAVHERIEGQLDALVRAAAAYLEAQRLAAAAEAPTIAFALVHAMDGAANAVANHRGAIDPRAVGRQLAAMAAAYLERLAASR